VTSAVFAPLETLHQVLPVKTAAGLPTARLSVSAGLIHKRTKRALRAPSCNGAPSKTGRSNYAFQRVQSSEAPKMHFRFAQMINKQNGLAVGG